jgi:cytoskeletal protein CcmA (bactofilin family)
MMTLAPGAATSVEKMLRNGQPMPPKLEQPHSQPFSPASPAVSDRPSAVACIGRSVVFKGDLISAENITIEGRFEGTIEIRNHDLVIGGTAVIEADVVAKTILVQGTVSGTLTATHKIMLSESAVIDGDITAPRLVVIDGATIKGRLDTGPSNAAGSSGQLAAAV